MKQPSYRDHDYVFGQAMLTLRSSMGLTQADLGVHLGVSRRSVVEWEAGTYYPKVEYLKELITLAVKHQVFSVGKEAEEIKTFWEAAHQKVPLNETWLAKLLSSTQPASLLRPANNDTPNLKQVPIPPEKSKGPRVAWDNAMAVPSFYGRAKEWALLSNWIIEDRCRIVSVLGMGGIGKSTLVVKLMHLIAENFEVVIWRSLRDTPKCDSLVEECLQILAPQPQTESAADPASRLKTLLDYMRNRRILLVLDNLETLLVDGEGRGAIRPGYDDYQQFLKLVAETQHQSCLVLTSREKVPELISFEGSHLPVRALRLSQLDNGACEMLLNEKDVLGTPAERVRLINAYAGNPLALKIVGRTIVDLFDGEVGQFLAQGEIIFGGVRNLLDQQFNRLGGLEQTILLWLAILREPASLDELAGLLVRPVSRSRILETLEGLYRRSLIERGQRAGSFTLQSVVLEYATSRLIETVSEAILAEQLNTLIEHGLALAGAR